MIFSNNRSRFVILVLLLPVSIFISDSLYSQIEHKFLENHYETHVSIDTMIQPDRIYMTIRLSEEDHKFVEDVKEKELELFNKLLALNINLEDELIVKDLRSNIKNYKIKRDEIIQKKEFELLVYDAEKAGKVVSELEKIGIGNVYISRVEYSKKDELEVLLKKKALLKAKSQSEEIISLIDQKIGKVLYMKDSLLIVEKQYRRGDYAGIASSYRIAFGDSSGPIKFKFDGIKFSMQMVVVFSLE